MMHRMAGMMMIVALYWSMAIGADAPSWLDTVAPVVTFMPKERFHNRVFDVSFNMSKPGRILVARNGSTVFEEYKAPIAVIDQGKIRFSFYGEDVYGNKSRPDTATFNLDMQAPQLGIEPPAGRYRSRTIVRFHAGEPVRYFFRATPPRGDSLGSQIPDSLVVSSELSGYVTAVDYCGNRSAVQKVSYLVDSVIVEVRITPPSGLYSRIKELVFSVTPEGSEVLYSFDPLAPPQWFTPVKGKIFMPAGLTVVRFFGRDKNGWTSAVGQVSYMVDTIPPRVRLQVDSGAYNDTITLSTREPSHIYYNLTRGMPNIKSTPYEKPVIIPRRGMGMLSAMARDSAGNESEIVDWGKKYDFTPPVMLFSGSGGTFPRPCTLTVRTNKPARVLFTLDGTPPAEKGTIYANGIIISRDGTTTVRAVAVDDAENMSAEQTVVFVLDQRPPVVKVRIDGSVDQNAFSAILSTDREAEIHYELGGRTPTMSSPVYKDKIPLKLGDVLQYFAMGKAGNRSPVYTLDDLRKPMVEASVRSGVYNRRLNITFVTSVPARVFWRILPDSAFHSFSDTILLKKEGSNALEYYAETETGVKSPVRREDYSIDVTPPRVNVAVRKGFGDSAVILFQATENASIYFTTDGTSPLFSQSVRMVGNKFTSASDRIVIRRSRDVKLALYAEDASGNQSNITVMDVFKPRAIPNVPSGADKVYDRILSITFNTLDQSQVYFARHGHQPTIDSAVYKEPITLMHSDTITAFVVDASGYVGDRDTFVYLIDLPPSPQFTVFPAADSLMAGIAVRLDAAGTLDNETPLAQLKYRWDFEGDSVFDTDYLPVRQVSHVYPKAGLYRPVLEVADAMNRAALARKTIRVRDFCPAGMVFVANDSGRSFCIDRFEWPNVGGAMPLTGTSWVEARMFCRDAGKRLCGADEWRLACRGDSRESYPYGTDYNRARCPTEGVRVPPSGSFKECGEGFGLRDMVGSIGEWVGDRDGDYPLVLGGSFKSGKMAHCGLSTHGTVGAKSDDIGFRCCK